MSFFGFSLIGNNQVGIVTKNMFGEKMAPGQIIATNGEIGVQAETLRPGLYWRCPFIWTISKDKVWNIDPGKIGIVESIDGKPLPAGRLLGDEVTCNTFQDGKAFLDNGGKKGAQIGILRPGQYRINTRLFTIKVANAVEIPEGKIGIATAQDGEPLPSGYIVAPAPTAPCQHFQDGQAFINNHGYRGPQLETLQPGEFYINPLLFDIDQENVVTVPPGYVAVIISSVGNELVRSPDLPVDDVHPTLNQPLHAEVETVLINDNLQRGIIRKPASPGKYNLNSVAYRVELVPTSAIMIDWASGDQRETTYKEKPTNAKDLTNSSAEFFELHALNATAKDGFQILVDVKLIIRIAQENAAFVIARFGSIANLIEQVARPLIESSFRNEAGNNLAMTFMEKRTEFQQVALQKATEEFLKYHVEVQGLMIGYIDIDKSLLETQTKKQIAVQQQEQYKQEANAQEQRIAVMEKTARADKQKDVIAAALGIDIEKSNAEALVNKAIGIRDSTKTQADGVAYQNQKVGEGTAAAYAAQVKELGQDNIAILNLAQKIADGKIVITPNILVQGGNEGGNTTNLLGTFIAAKLAGTMKETPEAAEDATPK